MWLGRLILFFRFNGLKIVVQIWVDLDFDIVVVQVQLLFLKRGDFGLFLDFFYLDKEKFNVFFVGYFNLVFKYKMIWKQFLF